MKRMPSATRRKWDKKSKVDTEPNTSNLPSSITHPKYKGNKNLSQNSHGNEPSNIDMKPQMYNNQEQGENRSQEEPIHIDRLAEK